MTAAAKPKISYAEYLAIEERSELRHQLVDGEVFAMAGGTPEHSLLKTNLTIGIGLSLRGKPCRPFDSDLRVLIEDGPFATYPDLAVVCGSFQRSPMDKDALTNPRALFEVSSKSTAAWDLGGKFDRYALLDSLQVYVLVDSEQVMVRVFRRDGESWILNRYEVGDTVELEEIGATISVDELYEGWAALRESATG